MTIRAMSEMPANTPRPIGRTESCLPGSSNPASPSDAAAVPLALGASAAVLSTRSPAGPSTTRVVAGTRSSVDAELAEGEGVASGASASEVELDAEILLEEGAADDGTASVDEGSTLTLLLEGVTAVGSDDDEDCRVELDDGVPEVVAVSRASVVAEVVEKVVDDPPSMGASTCVEHAVTFS